MQGSKTKYIARLEEEVNELRERLHRAHAESPSHCPVSSQDFFGWNERLIRFGRDTSLNACLWNSDSTHGCSKS